LLFRLFLKKPKTAKKWLINLGEYQPGDVNTKLLELGIDAKEYGLYGSLSHAAHSNLLASLSHVQEIDLGEKGMLRVVHFGSSRTAETEYFIQQCFLTLFFLLHIALQEPLAELYSQHCESDVLETWYRNVDNLRPRLVDITSEMVAKPVDEIPQVNRELQELVNKKMRFEKLKKRIGRSNQV